MTDYQRRQGKLLLVFWRKLNIALNYVKLITIPLNRIKTKLFIRFFAALKSNSIDRMEGIGMHPHSSQETGLKHGMGPLNALGESHTYNFPSQKYNGKSSFIGFDSSKSNHARHF